MIFFVWAIFLILLVVSGVIVLASGILNMLKGFFDVFTGKGSGSSRKKDTEVRQTQSGKKKIIDKSEGEYVDFEEIK